MKTEMGDTKNILVLLTVNVVADNTTVWRSAFWGMLSETLALLKIMAKIPLNLVMPRQMGLPRVSQH